MLFELYMLVASQRFVPWVAPKRAVNVALWVTAAAVKRGAPIEDARLAATWAARESGGNPNALSPTGDCGLMQLHGPTLAGHSCADVMRDPVLAVSLWLDALDAQRARCSSTRAALGALSTKGVCGGAPKLVRRRCDLAEVSCS